MTRSIFAIFVSIFAVAQACRAAGTFVATNPVVTTRQSLQKQFTSLAMNRSGLIWRVLIGNNGGSLIFQVVNPNGESKDIDCILPQGLKLTHNGQFAIVTVDAGCEIRAKSVTRSATAYISILSTTTKEEPAIAH